MVVQSRPWKRLRSDEVEQFFDGPLNETGSYLKVYLRSGKSIRSKGWPWIQAGLRKVLGQDRVEKAKILRDGSLLLKTKNQTQTDKLLKTTALMGEECDIKRDVKLNVSRGTIHAYDLIDLTEDEVVHWLAEFDVTAAKRFTKRVGDQVENTPTILLTFDKPTCPSKLVLDYVTYHVKKHVPNPLICFRCGNFGHPEARCMNERKCLDCGNPIHDGTCERKCLNCGQVGHSCRSRECPTWIKEKDICALKVEYEIPYGEARRRYEESHQPPALQAYADVVRTPSASRQGDCDLKEKVEKLEKKIDDMTKMLFQVTEQLKAGREPPKQTDRHDTIFETGDQAEGLDVMDDNDSQLPMPDEHAASDANVTSVPSYGKRSKPAHTWTVTGGKGRGKGKGGNRPCEADADDQGDECSQSQPIVRRCRSTERVPGKPSVGKKSWKDST